jgi:hypothetical protein
MVSRAHIYLALVMLLSMGSARASSDPFTDFYGTYVVSSVYSLDPCLSNSDGVCSSVCCLLNATVMKTSTLPPSQGVVVALEFDPSTLSRCGMLSGQQEQIFVITSYGVNAIINTQVQTEVWTGMLPATIIFAGSGSTTQLQLQFDQCSFQTNEKSPGAARSYTFAMLFIAIEVAMLAAL